MTILRTFFPIPPQNAAGVPDCLRRLHCKGLVL